MFLLWRSHLVFFSFVDWELKIWSFLFGKRYLGTQACNSNYSVWDITIVATQVFGLCPLTWFFVPPPLCPFGICGLVAEFGVFSKRIDILESQVFGSSFSLSAKLTCSLESTPCLFSLFVHSPLGLEFVDWRLNWSFLCIGERDLGTQVFGHHSGEGCLSILYVELSLSPAVAAKNLDLHLVFFSRKKYWRSKPFMWRLFLLEIKRLTWRLDKVFCDLL